MVLVLITKSNLNCKFESFSNRLALLTVYVEYNNGRTHPLNIINAYAPTSNSSIIEVEHFYTTLESIINKVNFFFFIYIYFIYIYV